MKVIFLDIDGVLVTNRYLSGLEQQALPWRDAHGHALFCPKCVANLETLIRRTGAAVVLSSSWRYQLKDAAGITAFFGSRGVQIDIIDRTPRVDLPGNEISRWASRGHEIKAWLEANPQVMRYCILDDDPYILPEQHPFWVRTTWQYGFTRSKLEKAVGILSE
jgi:hypothetical protein